MLVKEGVRLNTIGYTSRLPDLVKKALAETMQATKNGDQIHLLLTFCCRDRWIRNLGILSFIKT
ncbi:MAG: undecaprenyl diphosphate synthase family protein [Candidatus Neptunochlamydia sp.]|nr:undecaprenyl diphosphate synthase family protein [Candidatus Neptunochlamydia sp.]